MVRRWRVLHDLRQSGVRLIPDARNIAIDPEAVTYETGFADRGADRGVDEGADEAAPNGARNAGAAAEAGAAVAGAASRNEGRLVCDHVIVAQGARTDTRLAEKLRGQGFNVHVAGDCAELGYIPGAMRAAAEIAQRI